MQCEFSRPRRSRTGAAFKAGWLVVLLIGGGCSSGPGAAPRPEDGRNVADAFLAEIRNDHVDAAWESTTAEFKSDMGRENFRKFARKHPLLKEPLEFAQYEPDKTNGVTRGACDYRTPEAAKVQAKVRLLVAREGKDWKVERLIVE
jgi:hypothetical protein